MRIAIDASPLAGPWGGVRRYTLGLLRALARVAPENDYELVGLPRGFTCRELGEGFSVHPQRMRLERFVDQFRLSAPVGPIDLFHGTNYTAPLWRSFPVVLTVHDLSVALFPETHPRRRRLRHRLLPTLCRGASRIIADSRNTMLDLVRCYGIPPERIDVIYLAAEERFHPVTDAAELEDIVARYALPERFVLYVGSVEPRKNLPVLLETLGTLRREGRPETLVIAGGGEPRYLAAIRRVIRNAGLVEGEDVRLTGPVDDADLPALYSLCTLFVYPSLYEGFGLPPVEAMACGAPVLIPHNSSLAELYEEASAFVDLTRPDGMVRAMRTLLDDAALRAELIEKGRKRAQSRSWEDIAAETLDVYRRAASAG